ncbi:hypothetical protein LZ31DRAFT_335513 [Colletotrichum somersetense]|nr:hypothetical protein LZ31DRAFT_335513 [Colletotrichum somersetense]
MPREDRRDSGLLGNGTDTQTCRQDETWKKEIKTKQWRGRLSRKLSGGWVGESWVDRVQGGTLVAWEKLGEPLTTTTHAVQKDQQRRWRGEESGLWRSGAGAQHNGQEMPSCPSSLGWHTGLPDVQCSSARSPPLMPTSGRPRCPPSNMTNRFYSRHQANQGLTYSTKLAEPASIPSVSQTCASMIPSLRAG